MIATPQLILHSEFHKGIWLLPVEGSKWYYFSKCDNPNHITNENFLESVDEPLRELVRFLHSRNIRTTPSCSGHNFEKDYFELIYSNLKKDQKEIRNRGLLLKDIECGSIYLFKDQYYKLPWGRNDFVDFAYSYQKKGVIGLRLDKEKGIREKILELKIPEVVIKEKDGIIFIFTNHINLKDPWQTITTLIKNIFEERVESLKTNGQ